MQTGVQTRTDWVQLKRSLSTLSVTVCKWAIQCSQYVVQYIYSAQYSAHNILNSKYTVHNIVHTICCTVNIQCTIYCTQYIEQQIYSAQYIAWCRATIYLDSALLKYYKSKGSSSRGRVFASNSNEFHENASNCNASHHSNSSPS